VTTDPATWELGMESWEPLFSRRQIERIPIESMVPSTWPDLVVPIMQLSATLSWPSKKQAEAIGDVANQLLGPEGNGQGRWGFGNGPGRKAAGCETSPWCPPR